jgi:predicted  nucleic acid-binding Zn-ribbon protein
MTVNQLQIEEVNQLLREVEGRIESLMLERQRLDAVKDATVYHALGEQMRALNDQHRMLSKRWSELTAGYSDNG